MRGRLGWRAHVVDDEAARVGGAAGEQVAHVRGLRCFMRTRLARRRMAAGAHVRARPRTPRTLPAHVRAHRARPRTPAHVRARPRHCPGSLTLRFPHAQIPSRSDSVQGVPRYAAGRDGVRSCETIEGSCTMRNRPYPVLKCSRSCGAGRRGLAREGAGKCPRVWGPTFPATRHRIPITEPTMLRVAPEFRMASKLRSARLGTSPQLIMLTGPVTLGRRVTTTSM